MKFGNTVVMEKFIYRNENGEYYRLRNEVRTDMSDDTEITSRNNSEGQNFNEVRKYYVREKFRYRNEVGEY